MANIAKVFKDEISRIAKKEVKSGTTLLKKDSVRLKRDVADLKRRLIAVERDNRQLVRQAAKAKAIEQAQSPADVELRRMRASGAMIIKLREKLGLTQNALGKLLGVSGQSVYQYETQEGRLRLREQTKAALAKVRQLGKREAQKKLEEMG